VQESIAVYKIIKRGSFRSRFCLCCTAALDELGSKEIYEAGPLMSPF